MRIVIIGGTFNPVHLGHLILAEEVFIKYKYNLVIFIPSNKPAHKETDTSVDASHRLKMLELAITGISWININDCEIKRGGISYSIDTIEELPRWYNFEGKPGFVVGDDLLRGFDSWKEASKLANSVDLIIARRKHTNQVEFKYPHKYLDNPIVEISSSQVRDRIRQKRAYRFFLPEKVYNYIIENKLYMERK
ncbi:MAG: nicotinate (nicotinamide) nucleotide adenylyltransferase [Spirochaetes bacterium]|nr:MAG: nicotinate (nicotinamide) nucleotide adenylyltransferase [Spirochaetota bacterium]